MTDDLTRRKFLERIGLTTAGLTLSTLPDLAAAQPPAASSTLPTRTLGRTNAKVSILAFGCGRGDGVSRPERSWKPPAW